VLFDGRELLTLDAERSRAARGARIAMIFQEPMTSLNPAFTVGDQIVEAHPRTTAACSQRGCEGEGHRDAARCVRIPRPSSASTSIRTSSRAACASA
jgi:ABC-type microcin C transport system duplicated ATPase subunit YejF